MGLDGTRAPRIESHAGFVVHRSQLGDPSFGLGRAAEWAQLLHTRLRCWRELRARGQRAAQLLLRQAQLAAYHCLHLAHPHRRAALRRRQRLRLDAQQRAGLAHVLGAHDLHARRVRRRL